LIHRPRRPQIRHTTQPVALAAPLEGGRSVSGAVGLGSGAGGAGRLAQGEGRGEDWSVTRLFRRWRYSHWRTRWSSRPSRPRLCSYRRLASRHCRRRDFSRQRELQ